MQVAVTGGESVNGSITLSLLADLSGDGVGHKVSSVKAVVVDTSNVKLDTGVVLGCDQSVGG